MSRLLVALLVAVLVGACGKDEPAPPTEGPAIETPERPEVEVPEKPEVEMEEAEGAAAEANDLLAQLLALIGEGKLGEAKAILEELEGMKTGLPEDLRKKIDDAASALKAKEAAGGVKIPGR